MIVINRDSPDDWRRIGLVDDYGRKIDLSAGPLRRLAEEVLSPTFTMITGL